MRLRATIAAAAVLALVGGCTDREGSAPGTRPPSTLNSTGEVSNGSAASATTEAGSLDDFFGSDDPEEAAVDLLDRETRVQEAIRLCMAQQGFEYRPRLPSQDSVRVLSASDREDWIRQHGFGITTWFGAAAGPTPALSGEEGLVTREDAADPNQDLIEAMSEAQRRAWEKALYGKDQQATTDGPAGPGDAGFGGGCAGEAHEAEYGDAAAQELWQELEPGLDEMRERVESDPRILEADREWATCMAAAGYELGSRSDLWDSVQDEFRRRLEEIAGPVFDMGEGGDQADVDEVDMEALKSLQQEEIDMAVADLGCAEEWQERHAEVLAEYEARFIEENRTVLEEIRDS